jgi:hypothetical protein
MFFRLQKREILRNQKEKTTKPNPSPPTKKKTTPLALIKSLEWDSYNN